ncbi:MAG: UPF0147 family protein [Candidatus Nanoarchaeia archaeon]|jgi:hypothetical protein|nr:UPF0147 family protein [Candidatus Nanoarchaeia archaeon]|tara:strand:- start:3464 stop:3706 length:243 start_codon:yes stop_codon:yes gene_type:complete
MDTMKEVIELLIQLEQEGTLPKNIRSKIKNTMNLLDENLDVAIKIDKSLQELDEIAEDPNVPSYARTQIWNVMSLLESRK